MSSGEIGRWFEMAETAKRQGNPYAAIEYLKRVLAEVPESADAHALISICLLDTKRLHAAEVEADLALMAEPELALAHFAKARVMVARRRFGEAEQHFARLLESEPETAWYYVAFAEAKRLAGRPAEARPLLDRALSLEPDSSDVLAALGELDLEQGRLDAAEQGAEQALRLDPECVDAVVLMGNVALKRGDVQRARDHAIWALSNEADDPGALHLMVRVKARESWLLGWWWRYSVWIGDMGAKRGIGVLIGAFVAYRVLHQVTLDVGYVGAAQLLELLWIGVCVYSWVGPGIFRRKMDEEIAKVRLRTEF